MQNFIFATLINYNQLNRCRFYSKAVTGYATNRDYVYEIVNSTIDSSNRLNSFGKEFCKVLVSLTKPNIMLR